MAKQYKLYINGKWTDPIDKRTFESINPYDQSVNCVLAEGDEKDIELAVQAAHKALPAWKRVSPTERTRYLLRMADGLKARRDEFARMESMDVGKPLRDAYDDMDFVVDCLQYWAGACTKIIGEVVPCPASGMLNFVTRDPVGVCGLITPWNFPLQLGVMKIGPALACGNTLVLKPATVTPWTGTAFAEICDEAGLPPGVFNVVTGKGSVVGEALVKHPLVRKVSLTGDTSTGKRIMCGCAENVLKRATLELGGKSPSIIFADSDVEEAARQTAFGLYINSGQICCAMSRIVVEKSIHDQVVEIMVDETRKLKMGNPLDLETRFGPLVSKNQLQVVRDYVELGKKEGCSLVCGGDEPGGDLAKGNFYNPTLFTRVNNKMRIAQEEIFGPVGVIIPFETAADAVAIANDSVYGLAAAVWTRDIKKAHRVSDDLISGSVWVNTVLQSYATSPWGGPKDTGIGRDNAMQAIEAYTEMKSVYVATNEYSGKTHYD